MCRGLRGRARGERLWVIHCGFLGTPTAGSTGRATRADRADVGVEGFAGERRAAAGCMGDRRGTAGFAGDRTAGCGSDESTWPGCASAERMRKTEESKPPLAGEKPPLRGEGGDCALACTSGDVTREGSGDERAAATERRGEEWTGASGIGEERRFGEEGCHEADARKTRRAFSLRASLFPPPTSSCSRGSGRGSA